MKKICFFYSRDALSSSEVSLTDAPQIFFENPDKPHNVEKETFIIPDSFMPESHELLRAARFAKDKGFTHIICLSSSVSEASFKKILAKSEEVPNHAIVLAEKKEKKKRSAYESFQDTLLGDNKYKDFSGSTWSYPISFLDTFTISKKNVSVNKYLFIRFLWSRKNVEKLSLGDFVEPNKPMSWKEKFWTGYYDLQINALSNIHGNTRPMVSAWTCGAGAFIACTPFYGLQTALIFIFCYVFRLSFPIAFLGSQVSLPPIYSFIVPLEIFVGLYLTGTDFDSSGDILALAQDHFMAWVLGALVVGCGIGLVVGISWFLFQKKVMGASKTGPIELE